MISIEEFQLQCTEIRRKRLETADSPTIVISSGTCGRARGSAEVAIALEEAIRAHNLKNKVGLRITGCHGFCQVAPIVVIQPENIFYQGVTPEDAEEIVTETVMNKKVVNRLLYPDPQTGEGILSKENIPFFTKQRKILLENNTLVDPTNIDDYIGIGGYSALCKALRDTNPEGIIETIKSSGLRGRGGAGFPTGLKWHFCRNSKGDPKYIVCNADEGDPGAYMNRSLLEGNPHSVLEGMLIGAYAIGAQQGYIYIRHEYPLAVKHVLIAVEQMREKGLLGKDILGTGFNFDIRVVKGAGAFVCGEETALIASVEGRKGEPRQRPPFPAQKGIWGKPTNINNVETWANVPHIINNGAEWYSQIGTERSKGTKIFSLVGKINNTGLVEVPMGITLKEMVYDIGGGIPKGRKFKAVQTGGPSGGCIPADLLGLKVDYEQLKEVGSIMGSGGMVIMDEDTCMVDTAKYFLEFLQEESCGKCTTCREGIERLIEILTDITEGRGSLEDLETLRDLGELVRDASMCGLGQTAPNPLLSTLNYFYDEYLQHIKYKRCPAAVCKEITSAPCQHTCPIGTEAVVYISLIAQGRYDEAFTIIRKDNPLPSVCARVCSHPCESKCQAGKFGDPIAIRALKRFATDYAMKNNVTYPIEKESKRKEKVAIIGSGPGGLTAGYYLAAKGYNVTIFESLPVLGGALAIYIPEHRLPRDILNHDIENIKRAGVEFRTNTTVGKDIPFKKLKDTYDAIFIATGAHKSMELGILGEEAEGVIHALDFLKDVSLEKDVTLGQRVGIIGGGNAAVDAARVAARLKDCDTVTILYRRTQKEMPAFEEEIVACLEEQVDIQFLTAPKRILTQNGKVTGVECVRMQLGDVDESGRRRPIPIEGSEFVVELDTLVVAISERPDVSFLKDQEGMEFTTGGALVVDPETYATGVDGVFAGGDVVTGPNVAIYAMGAGKVVAEMIHQYLQGKTLQPEYKVTRPSMYLDPVELSEEEVAEAERPAMRCISTEERTCSFKEVDIGLSEEQAVKEARRCLRCDLETKEGRSKIEEVTA
ncbi:MAG: FAD-dependent oxidoreductase [Theionarchaea archaeon]|nr:FAD-dependent oxidoreductase [Theionarchaea archaeon]MBU7019977.1 FAD-dependent oxidoreductase [Theionarchaea archaeon]